MVVENSVLQQVVLETRLRSTFTPRFAVSVKQGCALLDVCAFDGAPPHLVLSDYALPDGDGFAVLEHARLRFPRVPRVLMSSSSPSVVDVKIGDDLVTLFVRKPVRVQELLHL